MRRCASSTCTAWARRLRRWVGSTRQRPRGARFDSGSTPAARRTRRSSRCSTASSGVRARGWLIASNRGVERGQSLLENELRMLQSRCSARGPLGPGERAIGHAGCSKTVGAPRLANRGASRRHGRHLHARAPTPEGRPVTDVRRPERVDLDHRIPFTDAWIGAGWKTRRRFLTMSLWVRRRGREWQQLTEVACPAIRRCCGVAVPAGMGENDP